MKKILALLLAGIMTLSMVACDKNDDKSSTDDSSSVAATDPSSTDESEGDTSEDESSEDESTDDSVELFAIPEESQTYKFQQTLKAAMENGEGITIGTITESEGSVLNMEMGILSETVFYVDMNFTDADGMVIPYMTSYCDGTDTYAIVYERSMVMKTAGISDELVNDDITEVIDETMVASFEQTSIEIDGVTYDMEVLNDGIASYGYVFDEAGNLIAVYEPEQDMVAKMTMTPGFDQSKLTYPAEYTLVEA